MKNGDFRRNVYSKSERCHVGSKPWMSSTMSNTCPSWKYVLLWKYSISQYYHYSKTKHSKSTDDFDTKLSSFLIFLHTIRHTMRCTNVYQCL